MAPKNGSNGVTNHSYDATGDNQNYSNGNCGKLTLDNKPPADKVAEKVEAEDENVRVQWGSGREFLMSCISMSVGLGNVWRFPNTAYENGGGAFLIPYIIILTVVGRPFYLLEMILGQFSSKSTIKVWDMVPALKGIGFAQLIILVALASYYCSLMAITLFYLVASFSYELPWAKCRPEWGNNCLNSTKEPSASIFLNSSNAKPFSSAELYYFNQVLKTKANLDDGLGAPDVNLTICLAVSWVIVFFIVVRGVKSSGKAMYFLATFPYLVLIGLLIRAVTLEGAFKGIEYLFVPKWDLLWKFETWLSAVSQCFFSLTVCFGAIVMFSSHNRFEHNIYRDAQIVTSLDIFTSLLSGVTCFAILGNLAHELGSEDVSDVARAGPGLAFISYPDAIAKFTWVPQFFAFIFFFMLFLLGMSGCSALTSSIINIVHDYFPKLKVWKIAVGVVIFEFFLGLMYVTPGGQMMISLVDKFSTSFLAFIPALFELIAVCYVYGLKNFLNDVEFMLGRRLGIFWRFCWFFLTPFIIAVVLVGNLGTSGSIKYTNNVDYPTAVLCGAWFFFAAAAIQLPIWFIVNLIKKRHHSTLSQILRKTLEPSEQYGPLNKDTKAKWLEFKADKEKSMD